MSRPRVLLAEDHPLVREAIVQLLAEACDVVGVVKRGDEIAAAAGQLAPDVILLDIALPGVSGLQVLPGLRASLPATGIVMLTSHADPLYRKEAFRRGADGYVVKGQAVTELLPAIREVLARAPRQQRQA